mmetsp:Transcript_20099/g.29943  ORF Transcript_20099/g.29943 Transcript_20099/m.29943 type:complete len:88 (-) Transcript_20099:200-463(-)|eukprot:4736210-Ditylum_brightwellii.AAC.1
MCPRRVEVDHTNAVECGRHIEMLGSKGATGDIERLGVCGHSLAVAAAAVLNVAQVVQNGQDTDALLAGNIDDLPNSIQIAISGLGQI